MAWGEPLGLDELMIVNPSPSQTTTYAFGENGTLYELQGLGQTADLLGNEQYFLGDDGTLYELQGLGQTTDLSEDEKYFLGDDGTLYQSCQCHRR